MKILIDFDGTCVTHDFPEVGSDIGAVPVLKALVENGHQLILFTMRCDHTFMPDSLDPSIQNIKGHFLSDAVGWFKEKGIPLYGINTDPQQSSWTSSPKAYGELIIDDITLGCPLVYGKHSRPYVDWAEVSKLLKQRNIL